MPTLDPALAAYLARIPPSDIAKLTPQMFRGVLRAAAPGVAGRNPAAGRGH